MDDCVGWSPPQQAWCLLGRSGPSLGIVEHSLGGSMGGQESVGEPARLRPLHHLGSLGSGVCESGLTKPSQTLGLAR